VERLMRSGERVERLFDVRETRAQERHRADRRDLGDGQRTHPRDGCGRRAGRAGSLGTLKTQERKNMATRLSSTSPDRGPFLEKLDDRESLQVISGDGAITILEGTVVLSKGTAAAITLAAPTAGAQSAGGDDGKVLRVVSTTAAAHVITSGTDGFNAKGSS